MGNCLTKSGFARKRRDKDIRNEKRAAFKVKQRQHCFEAGYYSELSTTCRMSLDSVCIPRFATVQPLSQPCSLVSEVSLSNISDEHLFSTRESTCGSDTELIEVQHRHIEPSCYSEPSTSGRMSLESVHPPRLVNLKPLAQSCSLLRRSVSEMSLSNISNEHIFPMKESTSLSDRQLQNIELDVSDSDLNPQNNSKVSCQIPLKKANSLSVIAQEMYAEFSFVKPLMHVSQIDINRDTKSQKLTEVNGNVVNLGKGAPQSVSLVSNSVCELPHFVQRGEFNRVCETLLKLSEHHCQQKSPSRIDWNALGDTLETLAGQQTLLENMIKNAIENAIHVRNRAFTIKLLDFACQLHKTQAPDTITDIWPAYQEGSEWDPVFVVLSQQKHPDDQYLGFKRHWRHSDLVSREGCIVAYSDEVRDNPLSFQDMERMRKLIRTADLFNFHSKITLTNACPCRSRNGGRDISVEMCIVIYTSVKGFIPFDEQPFPKTVFGIPVDVREGYVTLGGKWQAPLYVDCEREFSYTTKNQIKNSSTLLNYENGTTDMDHNHSLSPHMHGQKSLLQIQRRKEPYSIFKPTNQIKRNGTNAVTKSSEKLSTSVNELRELKNCVYNSQHRFPPDGQEAPTNSNGLTNPTSNQFQLTSNDSNVNHFVIKTKHMTDLLIKNNDQQSPETAATISLNNVCKSISHSDCNTRHTPEDLVSLSNKFSGQCCISVSEINDNVSTPKPLPFNFASDANILTIAASDIKGNAVTNQSSKEPVKTIFNQQFFQINDVTAPSAVSNNENTVAGSSMETNKVNPSSETRHTMPNLERRSKGFNETLLMGTELGVVDNFNSYCGTLGGFVQLPNGEVGALTCAHVMGIYSGTSGEVPSKLVTQPSLDTCWNDNSLQRYKVGHLYKAVFDNGCRDDVSVDAAVIKLQNRIPNTAEFTDAERTRLKSAGFEPEQPPNFSTGKILKYDQLKHFRNARVIKYGSQTGLTQGVIAMWGTDIKSDNQDMELPNKEKKVGFFNQIEIASLQYHSNFFDAGDSGSLVFVKQGDGPEIYCIGLAVGWTSYHSCLVTPIEEVFKKLGLPAKFIDDTKV